MGKSHSKIFKFRRGKMSKIFPFTLYRYRSSNNFANYIEDYLQGKIHFSPWREVNDPMEGYFIYYPQYDSIANLIEEKGKFKICCFSKSYSNYLLWSYYAQGHSGVCIEYEVKELPQNVIKKCVKYRKSIPTFDSAKTDKEQAIDCLTQKLTFWRKEEEIRLLLYDSPDPDVKIGEMKSITIGRRFSDLMQDEDHRRICSQLRYFKRNNPNFPIFKIMNINPDGTMERARTEMFG